LAGFQASDSARQQVWTLIAEEKETGLRPEQKLDMDDSPKLEHLLVLAKAKAPVAGAMPEPRPFSPRPLSSSLQKPNGDFVGRPLAGAFSERAQARGLRQTESSRLKASARR
jgi:hypothetical protein